MPESEEKPRSKELTKIVLEMLVDNEPKENIIESLKGAGLDEEEAEEVFKSVSKDYHSYVSKKLEGKVQEFFEEDKEELVDRFSKKVKETLEETELRIDLRFSEVEKEVDSRIDPVKKKADENRERVKQLRRDTEQGYRQLKKSVDSMELSGLKILLPTGALLLGAVLIIYSLKQTPLSTLYKEPASVPLLPLSLSLAAIIAGFILIYFGVTSFLRKRRLKEEVFKEK